MFYESCDFNSELPILQRLKNLILMTSMRKSSLLLLAALLFSLSSCSWFMDTYDGPVIASHGFVQDVTPSNAEVYNSRSYPTVQANWPGPGGDKIWLAVNLGATEVPETSVDSSAAAAGWFFQFNRKQAYYHNGSTLTPQWNVQSIKEDSSWEPANDPCRLLLSDPWRLPTVEELRAFREAPVNRGGMGEGNRTSAFNSILKLHAGGNLHSFKGSLQARGESGNYWASDQFSDNRGEALGFSEGSSTFAGNKASGRSVRCIKGV